MTVAKAIETVWQAGGEFLVPEPGKLQACVPSPRPAELEAALATIREHRDEALGLLTASDRPPEKLPPIVKGTGRVSVFGFSGRANLDCGR